MPEALSGDIRLGGNRLDDNWQLLAEKAHKAPIETLVARSADDIPIRPLYPRRPESGPRPWRVSGAWQVAQRLDHPDPLEANRLALLDLEGGADALTIVVAGSAQSRGFGLAADARTFDLALGSIELDLIAIRLDGGNETLAAAQAMAKLIEGRRLTSASLMLDLGFDPLGEAARSGRAADLSAIACILDVQQKTALAGRPLIADSRPYHEAGCGPAHELAAVLATATAYLRHMEALGIPLDAARGMIAILLAADADTFFSLAKFRAIRRLWARVETACGLASKPLRLHAETAWRMMSRIDPWVNAMRATSGIFAAGLGGADVVTALPFTLANGLPDAATRRLARNAQRVLIDEAHLDAVDDPAAGSGALDSLTDELCTRSWTLFQEIEREGGLAASLTAGALQGRIVKAASSRSTALATLREGLVGTSRFPGRSGPQIGVLDIAPRAEAKAGLGALASVREATPFETLRDRIDALAVPPQVFLATLGSPAAFGPRAIYATNFFAIAGIEAAAGMDDLDLDAVVTRFKASGTANACLCGTDASYADNGTKLAAALREAGAERLFAAGRETNTLSGIDDHIHDGCDALKVLATLE